MAICLECKRRKQQRVYFFSTHYSNECLYPVYSEHKWLHMEYDGMNKHNVSFFFLFFLNDVLYECFSFTFRTKPRLTAVGGILLFNSGFFFHYLNIWLLSCFNWKQTLN